MGNNEKRVKLYANARSLLEIAFGVATFAALIYVVTIRVSRSATAEEYLYWVNYFVVRALLSGLLVYSGVKSSGKNPMSLLGLNTGVGLACIFVGIMNILECALAKGDWKDVVAAFLYLPAGLVILSVTFYLRGRNGRVGERPP